jgi:hypothetical protein
MDFADAHRRAWEHQDHKRHAWGVLMEQSKELTCGAGNCIIYLGKDDKEPTCPSCFCLDEMTASKIMFFRLVLCYIKGDLESIIPLATSKALADERFYSLMCPKDDK